MAPMTVDVAMDMKETVSTLAQVITPKFHIILVFHGSMDCKMNSLIMSIATFFQCDWSSGCRARALYTVIPRPVNMSRYIKSLCDFASSLTFFKLSLIDNGISFVILLLNNRSCYRLTADVRHHKSSRITVLSPWKKVLRL